MVRLAEDGPGTDCPAPEMHAYDIGPEGGVERVSSAAESWHEDLLLLDVGDEEAILVTGDEIRHLPRGEGDEDLLSRVASGVTTWQREYLRVQRRFRLPDQLLAYWSQLCRARSIPEVCEALSEHATRVVGGYTALVYLSPSEGAPLEPVATPRFSGECPGVTLSPPDRRYRSELITASDALADTASPFSGLAPLFQALGAATLLHVPVGRSGVLFLVERRRKRTFGADEWDLLRTLARQADGAIERIRLFEEVRELSLRDPLTGLGNRRRLDVVVEHSLAAARRGQGLAVVMIDLDGFKEINDTHGHPVGDRVLCQVADHLRELTRGTDLVTRYGGDEFLIVLPGGSPEGAKSLLRRLRAQLAGTVEFTAGVAEFGPGAETAEELIQAADRDLYAKRRLRARWIANGSAPPAEEE